MAILLDQSLLDESLILLGCDDRVVRPHRDPDDGGRIMATESKGMMGGNQVLLWVGVAIVVLLVAYLTI